MNKIKSKISGIFICATLAATSIAYAQNTGDQPQQQPIPPSVNQHMNNDHNNTTDAPSQEYHNQNRHSSSRHMNNATGDNTNTPPCWRQNAQNDYKQNHYGNNKHRGQHRGHRYE